MPVVFIEGLPGLQTEAKKRMVEKITAAIDEAYHVGDTLIFVREYPAHQVAMNGQLQSENPKILEALIDLCISNRHPRAKEAVQTAAISGPFARFC